MKTKKFFFITHPYRTCIKNRRYLRRLKKLAAIGGADRTKMRKMSAKKICRLILSAAYDSKPLDFSDDDIIDYLF